MALIFISSESESARERLAERLAQQLGCECLCREDLVREAMEEGIPVGKLEAAIMKSPAVSERLVRQKELFMSFVTCVLCNRAGKGNLIYHGRAAHLLLQGIPHILRVRLVVDHETRVEEAMEQLGLEREKASEQVKSVDENTRRWVRHFYGADLYDTAHYDLVVNLTNMSVPNACEMLRHMAELPDFEFDAATRAALANRSLETRARMRLASDRRTADAGLRARAENGVVTVTYMPRQRRVAEMIPKALEGLEGCNELMCTMADANILWIQEKFDPESEAFRQLNEIARRWDAAIELARFSAVDEPAGDDGGVAATIAALISAGRSGGAWTIKGDSGALLSAVRGDVNYGLIAAGDCFLSKPAKTRTRMLRELAGHLAERVDAPVVTTDELQQKYLVGPKQLLKMLVCMVATAVLYFLVFYFQETILSFLGASGRLELKLMRVTALLLFIPLIAYLYSTVTSLFLKILKFE